MAVWIIPSDRITLKVNQVYEIIPADSDVFNRLTPISNIVAEDKICAVPPAGGLTMYSAMGKFQVSYSEIKFRFKDLPINISAGLVLETINLADRVLLNPKYYNKLSATEEKELNQLIEQVQKQPETEEPAQPADEPTPSPTSKKATQKAAKQKEAPAPEPKLFSKIEQIFPALFAHNLKVSKNLQKGFKFACYLWLKQPNTAEHRPPALSASQVFFGILESLEGKEKNRFHKLFSQSTPLLYEEQIKSFGIEDRVDGRIVNALSFPILEPIASLQQWIEEALKQAQKDQDNFLGNRHFWRILNNTEVFPLNDLLSILDVNKKTLIPTINKYLKEDDAKLTKPSKAKPFAYTSDGNQGDKVARINLEKINGEVKDSLDIEGEAKAFANLFMSKSTPLPLSVAVFGYWGSGKSFFMELIQKQIKDSTKRIREEEKEKANQPFHDSILQINFNAWHYIESNLWASLVDHIFTELDDHLKGKQSETEQEEANRLKRLTLFEKLTTIQQLKGEAEAHREQIEEELIKHQESSASQKNQEALLIQKRASLQARDLWELVQETIPPENEKTLKTLGLPVTKHLSELYAQGKELQSMASRVRALMGSLASLPWPYWVCFIGIAVLIPLGLPFVLTKCEIISPEKNISELVASVGSFLAFASLWLKVALKRGNEALNKLEGFTSKLSTKLQEKREANQIEIAQTEGNLTNLHANLNQARAKEAQLQKDLDNINRDLTTTSPLKRLSDFIHSRVGDQSYSKHLTLVSTIRKDFETLSSIMRAKEIEKKAIPEIPKATSTPWVHQLDRIILYVDDLDRCPPKKVVEVLQAVHLLLNFELFVVVVAVDERWVTRSLAENYSHLLDDIYQQSEPQSSDSNPLKNQQPKQASAFDYLEKIFQIPFWVKPMSEGASQQLIEDLCAGESSAIDARNPTLWQLQQAPVEDKNWPLAFKALIETDREEVEKIGGEVLKVLEHPRWFDVWKIYYINTRDEPNVQDQFIAQALDYLEAKPNPTLFDYLWAQFGGFGDWNVLEEYQERFHSVIYNVLNTLTPRDNTYYLYSEILEGQEDNPEYLELGFKYLQFTEMWDWELIWEALYNIGYKREQLLAIGRQYLKKTTYEFIDLNFAAFYSIIMENIADDELYQVGLKFIKKPQTVLDWEPVWDALDEYKPKDEELLQLKEQHDQMKEERKKEKESDPDTTGPNLPQVLTLTSHETELFQTLSPLYAASPRRVKRFINSYRVFKSSLDLKHENFVGESGDHINYKAVLLLLAILIGSPMIGEFLEAALKKPKKTGKGLKRLTMPQDKSLKAEWDNIVELSIDWVKLQPEETFLPALKHWIPLVRRYSFGTAHQDSHQ